MTRYTGIPIHTKRFRSPLRYDKNPGCAYKYTRNGTLVLVDWAKGTTYDAFEVVCEMYHCSFYEALIIICQDFNIQVDEKYNKRKYNKEVIKEDVTEEYCWSGWDIKFKSKFSEYDLEYWNKYGISLKTLNKFNVYPVKYALLDGIERFKSSAELPVFGYYFKLTGHVKIYSPLSTKEKGKWGGDAKEYDIQGLEQLNFLTDTLIITKSMKDVMVLYNMGYEAISFNGEGYRLKNLNKSQLKELINVLKNYKYIYILYDNDSAGNLGADRLLSSLYFLKIKYELDLSIIRITIKGEDKIKDISDLYLYQGELAAFNFINSLVWLTTY